MENNVNSRRRDLGLTVRQLSKISGVPASSISEVESGKREMGVYSAILLARALSCSVEELFPL